MFLLLVLGHFVVPFSILLSSEVKRQRDPAVGGGDHCSS